MINPVKYSLYSDGNSRNITITPVTETLAGVLQPTGVFQLSEAGNDIGDIVFDDSMHQWEYTAMGNLKHPEAEEIAGFIRDYKDGDSIS
jgi:hypothetical protein